MNICIRTYNLFNFWPLCLRRKRQHLRFSWFTVLRLQVKSYHYVNDENIGRKLEEYKKWGIKINYEKTQYLGTGFALVIAFVFLLQWKHVYRQFRVRVTFRLTVSQSVCLSVEPRLGLMTRYLLLFDSFCLVLGRAPSLTRGWVCPLSDTGSSLGTTVSYSSAIVALSRHVTTLSQLFYGWRFTDNQFVLATNPLTRTTRNFFSNLTLAVIANIKHHRWWEGGSVVYNCSWVLASAVILRSESRGTHDHILMSQIRDGPTWKARYPYLHLSGTGWPGYTPRHLIPFSSLPTACTDTVEVFEPTSTRASIGINVKSHPWK
jgi:hypothetical protein